MFYSNLKKTMKYISLPLSPVLLSKILVTTSQLWSKIIKWEIVAINKKVSIAHHSE